LKKNNIIKIAEIGLNHLGSEHIAKKYLNNLINTSIDGISFQIKKDIFYKKYKLAFKKKDRSFSKNFREKDFFLNVLKNNKIKKLTLSNNFYKYAIKKCKDNNKLVGFAVQDPKKIDFLNSQKIDFYKILNEDIDNKKLIKKISKNKNALKIISVSNDTINQIKKTIKLINQNTKTIISITDFNKKLNSKYLRKIKSYKKIFNLRTGYGNHSEVKSLSKVFKFKPELLLLYVKLDNKIKYPDSFHAISLNSLLKYL
jgi:sialic acid synthase SpsE